MLVLVLDTSSAAVTAGLVTLEPSGPQLLAERVRVNARGHAELLVPAIADCLREAEAGVGDVAAVIAGVGPGPFTGLRVGLMTATAFADARQIPTYGVCSLDAIAAIAARVAHSGRLLVAGDARRREIYWATYDRGSPTSDPAVGRPTEVSASLGQPGSAVTAMAGAGARMYADIFGLPVLDADYPTSAGLALVAADRVRHGGATETLTPLYLRRPDAVEPNRPKMVHQ